MKPQARQVLDYIKKYGSITSLEAIKNLGIISLSSRISELRTEHNIKDVWVEVQNRWGEYTRVKRYYLGATRKKGFEKKDWVKFFKNKK